MNENNLLKWFDYVDTYYSEIKPPKLNESGLIDNVVQYYYLIEQVEKNVLLRVEIHIVNVELYSNTIHLVLKSQTVLNVKLKPNINELFEGVRFSLSRLRSLKVDGDPYNIHSLVQSIPYPELEIVSEDLLFLLNEFDKYQF